MSIDDVAGREEASEPAALPDDEVESVRRGVKGCLVAYSRDMSKFLDQHGEESSP